MSTIRQLLAAADQRPQFIRLKAGQFQLGESTYDRLLVCIQEFVVVRKRFVGRQLECYSLDLRKSSKGTYCAFCSLRRDCHKRLRLLLLVIDDQQQRPAILEITHRCFESFDELVERVGCDELPETVVCISVVDDGAGRHAIDFRELF